MQQNMRPITKPDLNSVFESMLPLARTNPQYINAYLLTGTPEQKLAAAMIKDMPQGQGPSAPVQAPTQSVIEQKAAQVDPGIASLPVAEGMFDGGSYAGGGIIAFDEGGDVKHYATGDLVTLQKLKDLKRASVRPTRGGALYEPPSLLPRDPMYQLAKQFPDAASLDAAIAKLEAQVLSTQPPAAPTVQTPLAAQPAIDPNKKAGITEVPAAQTDNQLLGQRLAEKPTAEQMKSAVPLSTGKGFGLSTIDPANYIPKQESITDIEKEQADAYARAGVSDNPYEAGLKSIIARREKLAKSEEQAPWLSLAKAGFAMAGGKSQHALQNIAEGATVGLSDFVAAKDKLETRRDTVDDKEQAYTLAQNQYMQNRTDANLARVRTSKDKVESAQRELAVANNNVVNKGKELELNAKLKLAELDASNFNAAQTRLLQRLQLEKPDAFSVMLEAVNSMPGLSKSQRAEKLVEMTKKAASGSEGFTLQASIGKGVDDMFKDISTPLGKIYKAIANNDQVQLKKFGYTGKTGLAAANAYKDTYKNEQLATYGPKGAAPATATGGWGQLQVN